MVEGRFGLFAMGVGRVVELAQFCAVGLVRRRKSGVRPKRSDSRRTPSRTCRRRVRHAWLRFEPFASANTDFAENTLFHVLFRTGQVSCTRGATHRRRVGAEHSSATPRRGAGKRSEENTSELQSLMRISYAVFRLKK